jgi:hypothetical protein
MRFGWQTQVLRRVSKSAPSGHVDQVHRPFTVRRQVLDGQPAIKSEKAAPKRKHAPDAAACSTPKAWLTHRGRFMGPLLAFLEAKHSPAQGLPGQQDLAVSGAGQAPSW